MEILNFKGREGNMTYIVRDEDDIFGVFIWDDDDNACTCLREGTCAHREFVLRSPGKQND
jgi:hypothetical protein